MVSLSRSSWARTRTRSSGTSSRSSCSSRSSSSRSSSSRSSFCVSAKRQHIKRSKRRRGMHATSMRRARVSSLHACQACSVRACSCASAEQRRRAGKAVATGSRQISRRDARVARRARAACACSVHAKRVYCTRVIVCKAQSREEARRQAGRQTCTVGAQKVCLHKSCAHEGFSSVHSSEHLL